VNSPMSLVWLSYCPCFAAIKLTTMQLYSD
jgi:hypothetical protein